MNVDHPAAEEFLMHHGIKGMKWGVRRTPQQLGHAVAKKLPSGEKKAQKQSATKTPGKAFRKSTSISDEELQKRINRLNMEERYEDLVVRQKAREKTGAGATVKKLLAKNLESLGDQLLGVAVSKIVGRIRDGKKLDIDDYKDADINSMDSDTIAKVSAWYKNASSINAGRKALSATGNDSKKKDEEPKTKESSQKPKDSGSSETPKASESKLSNESSRSSSDSSGSTRVPWIYRASGTAYKKEAERIAKDRRNRDKDILKWLV